MPKCRRCREQLDPGEISTKEWPLAGPGLCHECYAKVADKPPRPKPKPPERMPVLPFLRPTPSGTAPRNVEE